MARKRKEIILQVEEKQEVPMADSVLQANDADQLESLQQDIDKARIELENTKREIEEKKLSLKTLGGRDITPGEAELSEKHVTRMNESQTLKDKIERERIRDSELVTGRFMNRRAPGQPVKLPYVKHSTDVVKWYPLEDGKVYTIPRGFADQLNGGSEDDPCYYTPHFIQKTGEMDPNRPASAIHAVDSSNKKYAFVSTSY